MNTNTTNTNNETLSVINPIALLADNGIKVNTSANAVTNYRRVLLKDGVIPPSGISDSLLCIMGEASRKAATIDKGMGELALMVGAAVYSEEWKTLKPLYPVKKKDEKGKETVEFKQGKEFSKWTNFVQYMLPTASRSTSLNYVGAVLDVIIPAQKGELEGLEELGKLPVPTASLVKAGVKDANIREKFKEVLAEMHKDKEGAFSQRDYKDALQKAKERANAAEGKKPKSSETTSESAGAVTSQLAGHAVYYSMNDGYIFQFGSVKSEGHLTVKEGYVPKFLELLRKADKDKDAAVQFVHALLMHVEGVTPEEELEG